MKESSSELKLNGENLHPGFSVDCVIFGFHQGSLKVLLNRIHSANKLMLPGGFVRTDESVSDAAYRHMSQRTGLKNVFLKQFYLFGDKDRTNLDENREILRKKGFSEENSAWFLKRYITVGYYALVEYSKVQVFAEDCDETSEWYDIAKIPQLYSDHAQIISKALEVIRIELGFVPIGHELLPEKFTMPELRTIYETIIGRSLDRRNFQRKMLSVKVIKKLNETRKSGAHKSPILYTFDEEKYNEALKMGFQFMSWKSD